MEETGTQNPGTDLRTPQPKDHVTHPREGQGRGKGRKGQKRDLLNQNKKRPIPQLLQGTQDKEKGRKSGDFSGTIRDVVPHHLADCFSVCGPWHRTTS